MTITHDEILARLREAAARHQAEKINAPAEIKKLISARIAAAEQRQNVLAAQAAASGVSLRRIALDGLGVKNVESAKRAVKKGQDDGKTD